MMYRLMLDPTADEFEQMRASAEVRSVGPGAYLCIRKSEDEFEQMRASTEVRPIGPGEDLCIRKSEATPSPFWDVDNVLRSDATPDELERWVKQALALAVQAAGQLKKGHSPGGKVYDVSSCYPHAMMKRVPDKKE